MQLSNRLRAIHGARPADWLNREVRPEPDHINARTTPNSKSLTSLPGDIYDSV